MFFEIIPQLIILICLFGIILILARKFPEIKEISDQKGFLIFEEKFSIFKKRNFFFKKINLRIKIILKKINESLLVFFLKVKKQFLLIFNLAKEEYLREKKEYRKMILEKRKKGDLVIQAKKFFKKKDFSQAEDLLIKAIQNNPKNIEAYRIIGEIYLEKGNLKDAKEVFEQILKIDPENKQAKVRLAHISKPI